ncbi:MAG: CDP-diacylglycerol--glycerol-3-phosphate 3-phosphatidyltransferase [Bdellovibrionales bacterium]|jgi:CDP-diacylglycerol--glycerol-3-phosphate 3-phosphatidyltransferase|nr:CDP-diacylglycerol--glycerol-3-phosphate 3-phosphatidyltransferase [Bdellovibrionales bacterium]MBT3526415.1 CDP-diacylglycerol--glycerol-3-phosphate 3-phosphatidyltransferase [Bdellovibrionales bacterium]MBT7669383.1 CDP-diacylglycerol--glycerol-3-phosphate 3-phosphatidyltransferase [Bdellovibrionales bacterium]MBT7768135.1 CDP-diacylglycerol--glycerol-3-phosphate 3-phosphatidyltransferase [Bdellovibrionales bacterium]
MQNIEQNESSDLNPASSKLWEIDNLPNRITLFRICLVPIVIASLSLQLIQSYYLFPYHFTLGYVAATIFIIASITDFIDGYIARKRNIVTIFGSFLDPIADKLLVVSSLILLQALDRIPAIIVVILVLRELYITSLRLLATDHGLSVPVGSMGKWKTAVQMIAIPMLMAYDKPFNIPLPTIGISLIYLASIIALYSALEYSLGLLKKLRLHAIKRKLELKAGGTEKSGVKKEEGEEMGPPPPSKPDDNSTNNL